MDEIYTAHIFGRRKRGEREEVRMKIFDEAGNPISMEPPTPASPVVKPLKIKKVTSGGSGQDGGPTFLVFGDFPDLPANQFAAYYIPVNTSNTYGMAIMGVSRELLVVKGDATVITSAMAGNGKVRIQTNSGAPNWSQVEVAELNYYWSYTAQPASYFNTVTHPAGTTIVITKAQHGIQDMGGSNARGLMVQVQDNATGMVEIPQSVQINASSTVTITFAGSVAANSKRISIVGGGPSTGW